MFGKNIPIRRKLRSVMLLTSGIVLLLTCAAFTFFELAGYRDAANEELLTIGRITAENSPGALAFRDETHGRRVLAALKAEPNIIAAALYDDDGQMFVKYPATNSTYQFPQEPGRDGIHSEPSRLILFQPVQESTRRFGTLYIEYDLGEMYSRIRTYINISALVLAGSFIVALFISNLLQRNISDPIVSLAQTARVISEKNDYSVRAKKESEDELGLLTDAFNQMLTEIHNNQARLHQALEETRLSEQKIKELNQKLEQRVKERTSELEDAVAQMEAFSYSVSHDLRAPLRAMQGFSQAILEDFSGEINDTIKDYLARIQKSAMRMDRLIQDILAYSRVARSDLQLDIVNLDKLVRDLVQQNPAFQPPDADVVVEKPLLNVFAHESALGQCLFNLFSNAVKFVPKGVKPQINVSTERIGPHVRISIQDNGIGINPDYRDRIFGMFERLNSNAYEGTGIGLAIVKKAVERMGGRVGVESEQGKGSRFWIQLPKG